MKCFQFLVFPTLDKCEQAFWRHLGTKVAITNNRGRLIKLVLIYLIDSSPNKTWCSESKNTLSRIIQLIVPYWEMNEGVLMVGGSITW